jgi:amino acid adenylation domain-containing protein
VGELHLGGLGLARGYLNQPKLTAQKFINNPYASNKLNARLYKTGDLVYWQKNGELAFVGRMDQQIKIRGFRIELAEIEQVLLTLPAVTQAFVTTVNDSQLVAYVVVDNLIGDNIDEAALKAHMSSLLPDHMQPKYYKQLAVMPLSATGKIDRKALPSIEPTTTTQYLAPQTESETLLAQVWQTVLAVEQVGREDNFFELGGHSLLIMQVITALQQQNIKVTAAQLFATPTLSALAKLIEQQDKTPQFKAPANGIPAGCERITPQMLSMISLNDEALATVVEQVPGGDANIQDIYPLAPLQQGILFHHMMDSSNDPYILQAYIRIQGRPTYDRFMTALKQIISRHDALRTAILWRNRVQPIQVVYRDFELPITLIECEQGDLLTQMQALSDTQAIEIDIEKAPLLDLTVAHDKATDQYVIRLLDHHVVSDHVSMAIIQQELAIIFAGQIDRLPPPTQYREFIAFAQHQANRSDAHVFFNQLLGDVQSPTLLFELHSPYRISNGIDEQEQQLSSQLNTQVRLLAKQQQLSPAVLFHSAVAMVVAACSLQDDIVFGSVMSGRLQGVENAPSMMGMFINTLPLRVKLANQNSAQLINQVRQSLLDLMPYEQTSLALAQNCSALDADQPLFNTLLNYRHTTPDGHSLANIEFIDPKETSNYPLTIAVDDFGNNFLINVQIHHDSHQLLQQPQPLQQQSKAAQLLAYIQTALSVLTTQSTDTTHQQIPINQLSILPAIEHERQIKRSVCLAQKPQYQTVNQWFTAKAKQQPNAIALIDQAHQLTYQMLDEQSNQLAHYLVNCGVKSNERVGICVSRTSNMVICQLAIFKAGAAYVPLDASYPTERLNYTIADSQISHLLAEQALIGSMNLPKALVTITIDSQPVQQAVLEQPLYELTNIAHGQLAYVIYTSGSTGQPKGVMISQLALVNFLNAFAQRVTDVLNKDCRLLALTTMAFDIAGLEIFGPLVHGGQVILASKQSTLDGGAISQLITQHDINCLQATPATWQMLMAQGWSGKQDLTALCGGEAMPHSLASYLLPRCSQLFNCYGPTEATIWSLVQQVTEQQLQSGITIGGALNNYRHLVLDKQGQLIPQGAVGELVIGGPSLAQGYYGQAEKSQAVFVTSALVQLAGERLYHTGDLVRAVDDHCFEFIGRCDEQVKIRGFRIEPGEIEQQIQLLTQAQCLVMVKQDQLDSPRLVAYLSECQSKSWPEHISQLKQQLSQVLPEYMCPTTFVPMKSWPLTPNGKVNKKALPQPDFAATLIEFVAPFTEQQRQLAVIWADLLGLEVSKLSIHSHFFELGGHSLLAMNLIAQIENQFQVSLSLQALFKAPTIDNIAAQLPLQLTTDNDQTLDFMDQLLGEFEE